MARSQNFKVGLFVISAIGILLVTVLLITGIRLAEPLDRYYIRFDESVSGLDPGSPVKYRGVRIGTVQELSIPADDITKVEVWIGVKRGMAIKTDTKASLNPVGITGLIFVNLSGGTPTAPDLPLEGQIESKISFLETLTGSAASAAVKVDGLLDNLLFVTDDAEFDQLKSNLHSMHVALLENSAHLNDLLEVSTSAATRLDSMLTLSNGLMARNEASIERSLADLEGGLREMHMMLAEINNSEMIANLNTSAAATRDVMTDVRSLVDGNRHTLTETLANLREVSANMNEFSRLVREKPSLLIRSTGPGQRRLPGDD